MTNEANVVEAHPAEFTFNEKLLLERLNERTRHLLDCKTSFEAISKTVEKYLLGEAHFGDLQIIRHESKRIADNIQKAIDASVGLA